MDQTRSGGLLLNLCRVLLFGGSLAISLGWLVAPETIARARNVVAGYLASSSIDGGARLPVSAPAIIPAVAFGAQPLHAFLTRHHLASTGIASAENDLTSPSTSSP